jgi:hypothetical protein
MQSKNFLTYNFFGVFSGNFLDLAFNKSQKVSALTIRKTMPWPGFEPESPDRKSGMIGRTTPPRHV